MRTSVFGKMQLDLRCDHQLNSVEILRDVEVIIVDDESPGGGRANG